MGPMYRPVPSHDPNPKTGGLPIVVPQRDPMTLGEARILGLAAQRYGQLTDALRVVKSGSLTISSGNGAYAIALTKLDLEAALALLIEREAQHLASYGVMLEAPPL